eukprot:TRINITY_DN15289_c0_g1_i2.p1 TRINITY_DN15289_c0_g1~~TRINITY_DN15289_c0_g1_i2.p1  ORF type:complete len:493 (-),score=86.41 TRINITY_DN15289_c0_g1_i2:1544-3022(-)
MRARRCAKLTIPALLPEEGSTGSTKFVTPYQAIGARGVNNLSAKLVMSMLPTNSSFFRLSIDDFALEELTQQEGLRGQVEEALGRIERAVMSDIESSSLRTVGNEGFKQLIVAGNVLLRIPKDGEPRMYRIDKYVVRRSPDGIMQELIVRDEVAPSSLPDDVLKLLPQDAQKTTAGQDEKTLPLFTVVRRTPQSYVAHQEINDTPIPGTRSVQPHDACEWLPLRFIRVDGEDYGRGYVEEYFGDLKSLEGLEKAILMGAAAAAKVLFLVNPNGTTKMKDLAQAESGAVREGNAADVSVVQMAKYGDFRVALEKSQALEQRLSFAFLMNSAIQRNGERVTAEEIRFMARELEDALGGIYSILAQEFQRPLVNIVMAKLRRTRKLPSLPKGVVRPVIVTGLEALGRGQELDRLRQFIGEIAQTFPQALNRINPDEYLKRTGTALSLDLKGLLYTEAQLQQQAQAAQQQSMMQSLVDKGTAPTINAMVQGAAQPA